LWTAVALGCAEQSFGQAQKMKDKAFARSVDRDEIINGAADLGIDLKEYIVFCIEAMNDSPLIGGGQ
jgi:predicted hydrolase (HD superfamily)